MKLGGLLRGVLDSNRSSGPTAPRYAAVEVGPLCVRRLEERRVMAAAPLSGALVDESVNIGMTAVFSANPPIVHLPGDQSAVEGAPFVFSDAGGRSIRIDDPDIGVSLLQVQVTAFDSSGLVQPRLTLGSTAGLLSSGDGTSTIQLQGTLAAINAALSHVALQSQDNGNITLDVTAFDPSTGDTVSQSIGVSFANAVPQLSLPAQQNTPEGQLLSIPIQFVDLGSADTVQTSWTVFYRGAQVAAGAGPLVNFLAANDGHYDVTVNAVDDDGGVATLTQRVSIDNVSPGLTLSSFTLGGLTYLTVHIDDPGAEQYTVEVYWTQNSTQPQTFTTGLQTFTLTHQYNAGELAAGEDTLSLTVHVLDNQDFGRGSLNFVEAAPVQTQRPKIEPAPTFRTLERTTHLQSPPTKVAVHASPSDIGRGAVSGKQDAQSLQHFVVRLVSPDGEEYGNYTLADHAVEDLPEFLAGMGVPDGHYRVYFISGDQERLLIDGHLRAGRLIDPTDDSLASFDRPPGGELPQQLVRNRRHALAAVDETNLAQSAEVRRDDPLQAWFDSLSAHAGGGPMLAALESLDGVDAPSTALAAHIASTSNVESVGSFTATASGAPISPSLLNGAIFATAGAAVVVSRRSKAAPAAHQPPSLHRFSKAARAARSWARRYTPSSLLNPIGSTAD
jgi:hypothetical protein